MEPISFHEVDDFESFELDVPGHQGIAGLFTNLRIDRATLPADLHAYDIRGGGDDGEDFCTVEPAVTVNHTGTLVTLTEIPLTDGMAVIEDYNFDGNTTYQEWLSEQKA